MGGEDGYSPPNRSELNGGFIKEEVSSQSKPIDSSTGGGDPISDFDSNLPKTVTLLHGPQGSKLYLVGTAHFSLESQEDVSKVIRTVRPHIVVLELCRARSSLLRLDEKTIEQEVCNMSIAKMKEIVREHGFLHGMINILFLSLSAQLTRDLGMAPGGEFRRAFQEVKQIPGCMLHYGDRPIQITMNRAISVLSWWQRFRLVYSLLFCNEKFTKDDVEQLKDSDLLASVLKKMSKEFPKIGNVFVNERDIYLTFSLQTAAESIFQNENNEREPTIAVGVVGIGHVPGIVDLWMKVTKEDVQPVLVTEERRRSSGLWKKSLLVGAALLVGYKLRNKIKLASAYNQLMTWIK